jgi:hypothetical protein
MQAASSDLHNLYIWAQPMTQSGGNYHSVNNPFKELRNISLNLVTDQPALDFLDTEIEVYNPVVTASKTRFQFVFDSSPNPSLTSKFNEAGVLGGSADRIDGLQAFSIDIDANGEGLGPTCGNDQYCMTTAAGVPAWLVARVGYKKVADAPAVHVRLQIGANGMNHTGESSSATTVVFGIDTTQIYNAGTDRNINFPGDSADLTVCGSLAGDYNGNCIVDAADYTVWRDRLGQNTPLPNTNPSDNDNMVTIAEYNFWKVQFGNVAGSASGSGSLGGPAVPEPSSLAMLWTLAGFWAFVSRRCHCPLLMRDVRYRVSTSDAKKTNMISSQKNPPAANSFNSGEP